ncbi:hypothetical protein [Streptomyces zingiberis]|uniref:Secreted protein n=1 Tax=Streptomyces zingiberis TaxID=2053010 RepID=A0ABX1BSP7_9ACTN|nr:hypothetical protein [Streptomyces zingiberis]NJP99440.1 hypothetical protein [Streptomyces zingiberis]
MEAAIMVVVLLFVLFVAAGVYAAAKAVGAAKRGVDRTVEQARRTVEDTTLRARQFARPGAAGEVAQLRVGLRASLRATEQTLRAAAPEDPSLGEALGLFDRLNAHGRELDTELRRLEGEPDRAGLAARLPELRERTERIVHSADALRWAAQDRAQRFADDDLAELSGRIQMEAGALRHWAPSDDPSEATGGTPGGRAAGSAGSAGARGRDGAAPGSPAGTAGPARQEPPAITARDPRAATGFPWEKTRRPESTT